MKKNIYMFLRTTVIRQFLLVLQDFPVKDQPLVYNRNFHLLQYALFKIENSGLKIR